MTANTTLLRLGWSRHLGDVEAHSNSSPPRDPADLVAEALLGQRLTVGRRRRAMTESGWR